jgi:hypothetical protein
VAQYGLRVNAEFTTITGSGLFISDNYTGSSESGIIDVKLRRFLAAKEKIIITMALVLEMLTG